MEDTFTTYKKALKAKYEEEKTGENASFLFEPSPARIRDLTIFVLQETTNKNDLKIFQDFIGFAFEPTKIKKVKDEIDKFRPLATFLKGKTELSDFTSADMLAVILDFNARPYWNFTKTNSSETEIIPNSVDIDKKNSETHYEYNTSESETIIKSDSKSNKQKKETIKKTSLLLGISTGIMALCTSFFYIVKDITEEKCMVWNIDHYKSVDCGNIKQDFIYSTFIPSDEKLLNNFRKIDVNPYTPFFDAKKQPLVWYGKNANKEIEYFTAPGLHPETSKTLKPITKYMIKKYIK